jgi:hypothetical protein
MGQQQQSLARLAPVCDAGASVAGSRGKPTVTKLLAFGAGIAAGQPQVAWAPACD